MHGLGAVVALYATSSAALADTKVGVVIPLSGLTSQIGNKVKMAYELAEQ
jgi:hypothetical protein